MPTEERIQLAHGISDALRRFRGRGIDVEAMLTREDYARDILQQCRVSGDVELKALAARFSAACPPAGADLASREPRRLVVVPASGPPETSAAQRNRSWLAPLDVFSRRSGMPRN